MEQKVGEGQAIAESKNLKKRPTEEVRLIKIKKCWLVQTKFSL